MTAATVRSSGIILAGGRSRRMGRDKATLLLGGETLLERSIRVLRTVVDEVLVVGRAELRGAGPSARLIPDEVEGAGPLAGLAAGLRRAQAPYVLTVACDLPFLDARILAYLLALAPGHETVVPRVGGRSQPLHAVYASRVADVAEQQLAVKQRKLDLLLDCLEVRWVEEREIATLDPELRSFVNVNTPEEWEEVLQRSAEQPALYSPLRP